MPAVLTSADMLSCNEGQGVAQVAGATKLVVGGNPVLNEDGVRDHAVSGCTVPASQNSSPCTKVATISSGTATKLFVNGSPVLLAGLSATAAASPPHTIGPATSSDTKLEAS